MSIKFDLNNLLELSPSELISWSHDNGKQEELSELLYKTLFSMEVLPESSSLALDKIRTLSRIESEKYGIFIKDARLALKNYIRDFQRDDAPIFLDVGGGDGERQDLRSGFNYWLMDIAPGDDADKVIVHDITKVLPIESASVDVVYSNQVMEHLKDPFSAAREMARVLQPGGLCLVSTVFSYRYHPYPEDFWRFSHKGLQYLFSDMAGLNVKKARYDLTHRRDDRRGDFAGGVDSVPVDWLGGFRENWMVYLVGKKPD